MAAPERLPAMVQHAGTRLPCEEALGGFLCPVCREAILGSQAEGTPRMGMRCPIDGAIVVGPTMDRPLVLLPIVTRRPVLGAPPGAPGPAAGRLVRIFRWPDPTPPGARAQWWGALEVPPAGPTSVQEVWNLLDVRGVDVAALVAPEPWPP